MATTKDPIWRFAVPLSPTEKSYRPTHRARGARGAVAWDISYMSTIQLEGAEPAIQAVLMAVGVKGDKYGAARGRNGEPGLGLYRPGLLKKTIRNVQLHR